MQIIEYQCDNFSSIMNGKELKQLRAKKGFSQEQLAQFSGVPLGTIGRIESTGEEIKKVETTKKLQEALDNEEFRAKLSTKLPKSNAVIIGEITQNEESSPFIDIGNGQYTMVVPIVPIRAQAGYIEHYNDENYIEENFTDKHTFTVSRLYRGKYMAFIVDGDSMDNGVAGEAIPEGYTITGREIQKHLWKSKFHIHRYKDYVIVHQNGIYVKQITKHDTENGIITCHSLNTDYEDFDLQLDDCLQIFNVVNVTQTK